MSLPYLQQVYRTRRTVTGKQLISHQFTNLDLSTLDNRQHRFRRGLSCETQLCAIIHDILAATDKDQSVHAAVLDFTKAFDKVPHALLMKSFLKLKL